MRGKRRLYFKDIDVLRFIMILPILMTISILVLVPFGEGIGMQVNKALQKFVLNSLDFFFFLSAFLLTSHGLREYKYKKGFSLKYFYIRRLLRFFFYLFLLFTFTFFVHPWIVNVLKLFGFQQSNWVDYLMGIPNYIGSIVPAQISVIVIIWGMFMFLQFYFIWGLILKFFKEHLKVIAFVFIVLGLAVRIIHYLNDSDFTFDTLAYASSIGLGALLAYYIRIDHPGLEKFKSISKGKTTGIYGFLLLHLIAGYVLAPSILFAIIPIISAVLFSFVILEQTFSKNSIYKLRKNKFLSHLGKISFGFVVYYSITFLLVFIAMESLDFDFKSNLVKLVSIILTFGLSWLIADISYHFIEPALRNIRRNFKRE